MSKSKPEKIDTPAAPITSSLVTYVGNADVKILTSDDWARVVSGEQATTVWSSENGRAIDSKNFSTEALAWLTSQPGFTVT